MSSIGIGGLIAAYIALAVLLLSLHLYSSWNWGIKLAATLILAAFYFVTYRSLPEMLGWPTAYDLPRRIQLIGIDIAEPNYVYLWARDLERGLAPSPPRAYRLPYSTALHEAAEEAGGKLRKGLPVIGEIEPGGAARLLAGDGEAAASVRPRVRFVDAPEGLLPPKE